MKYRFLFIAICCLSVLNLTGQNVVEHYVETYGEMAVDEMRKFGIPASITLAQGILESGSGKSELAAKSNNHFGIKCHRSWTGDKTFHDDDAKGECFRVYDNASQSFRDHSLFLFHRGRYAFLFELDRDDYIGWAKGLKKAGYATNPKYANLLINLIEKYNLAKYDLMGSEEILADGEPDVDNVNNELSEMDPVYPAAVTLDVSSDIPTYAGVFLFNRIKTVIVQENDNLMSIANRHKIKLKRLKKYNEMRTGEEIYPGMYIYLQPKRKKGNQRYHVVEAGESMFEIAQQHGMKISELYEKNLMKPNQQAVPSEILYLRKFRESNPKVMSYRFFLEQKNKARRQNEMIREEEERNKKKLAENKKIEKIETPPQIKSPPREELEMEAISLEKTEKPQDMLYSVEKGDTLYSIAQWFKTSVDRLKEWNELQSNDIDIGQVLIVGK